MAGVWTLNWKALKNALLCGDMIEGLSAIKYLDGSLRTTVTPQTNNHGDLRVASAMMIADLVNGWPTGSRSSCLFVKIGSGNTAPAATDYHLETPLDGISYLSVRNEKPTWNTSTGAVSNVVILTVQNVNSAAVTVREWGIYNFDWGTPAAYLLYRAVLDSPVTIQPNQSAMLTLTRSVTLTDPVVWPVS